MSIAFAFWANQNYSVNSRLDIYDQWSVAPLIIFSGLSALICISLITNNALRNPPKISQVRKIVATLTFLESFVMFFFGLPLYFWLYPKIIYDPRAVFAYWYAAWLFGMSFFVFISGLFIVKRKYQVFSTVGLLLVVVSGLVASIITISLHSNFTFHQQLLDYLYYILFSSIMLFFLSFLIAGVFVLRKHKKIPIS